MLYLGCHLSATAGNLAMVRTAQSIGANTFAFFTRNPRGSKAKPEDPEDAARAVAALESSGRFSEEELAGVKKVLTAAALTYVAALLVSIANLLRLVLIVGGNNRRRR